jgi:predicted MFS family arabinose efflux permease
VSSPPRLASSARLLRFLRPLAHRDFALLSAARTVSLFGDGIYLVAVTWQVYALHNSPAALAVVGIAWTVPFLGLVLVGGLITDRIDRRRVMIAGDVIRGAAMAAVAALAFAHVLELWHLVALVALYAGGDALFAPAFSAIVPDLVPQDELVEANSLEQFAGPAMLQLAGPAIGGAVVAGLGTASAFAIDSASFVVSGLALAMIRPRAGNPTSGESPARELLRALRFVRGERWLWAILLSSALTVFAMWGPWEVLLPYLVKNALGGDAGAVGSIFAAGGAGSVVAAVAMAHGRRLRRPVTAMYLASAAGVLAIAFYGLITAVWQAMVIALLAGACWTVANVIWATLTQIHVPAEMRGRVGSLSSLAMFGLLPLSYAVTGPVASVAGLRPTLVGAGLAGAALTLGFLLLPGALAPEQSGHPPAA